MYHIYIHLHTFPQSHLFDQATWRAPHDYLESRVQIDIYLHQIFFRTLGGCIPQHQQDLPPAGHEPHRDLLLHADPSHHGRSPQEQWLVLQVSPSHVPTNHAPGRLHVFPTKMHNWLVVSTPLKNISQNGNLPQVGVKIQNIWNHHLDKVVGSNSIWSPKKQSDEKYTLKFLLGRGCIIAICLCSKKIPSV